MAIKAIQCGDCGEFKVPERFQRDVNRWTGRFLYCKECVRKQAANRRVKNEPRLNANITKVCNRCKQAKPMTFEYFAARRTTFDGFEYECKVCKRARRRESYYANKEQEYAWSAQRRARELANGDFEWVKYAVIFERDEGVCQICLEPIDVTVKAPHPRSGSKDHIVSAFEGGQTNYANIQLAHLGCNMSKAHRY